MAKRSTTITLSDSIIKAIYDYAKKQGLSKSSAIEHIIKFYLEMLEDVREAYLEAFKQLYSDIAEELEKLNAFRMEIVFALPSHLHLLLLTYPEFASPDPVYKKFYNEMDKIKELDPEIVTKITVLKYLNLKGIRIDVDKEIIDLLPISYPKIKQSIIYETIRSFYFKQVKISEHDKKLKTTIFEYLKKYCP